MNENITELLNEINKMPEKTLLEKMVSYCEENDIPEQELGDRLSGSDQFKRTLWINCVESFQIKDELLSEKWAKMENLEEW